MHCSIGLSTGVTCSAWSQSLSILTPVGKCQNCSGIRGSSWISLPSQVKPMSGCDDGVSPRVALRLHGGADFGLRHLIDHHHPTIITVVSTSFTHASHNTIRAKHYFEDKVSAQLQTHRVPNQVAYKFPNISQQMYTAVANKLPPQVAQTLPHPGCPDVAT